MTHAPASDARSDRLVQDLADRLQHQADPARKAWWERYLRHEARFRGVRMEDVRRSVHAWYTEHDVSVSLGPEGRFDLVQSLIARSFTEDRLAGILLLDEILIPAGDLDAADRLPQLAAWFDDGHLADWNVVDWTCVKALQTLVERQGEPTARAILAWHDAANLWRARASIVTYANTAGRGDAIFPGFTDALLEACAALLARPERFAKTGVGWVLRTLSVNEPDVVAAFAERRLSDFSLEALQNALKKLQDDRTGPLLTRFRELHR